MNARALLFLTALILAPQARADEATRRAREELERQLQQLVQTSPPRVRVVFEPLDEPNMKLELAEFMLNGRTLSSPSADALMKPGVHAIYAGEVPEGRHELIVRLAYVDQTSVVLSAQAGFRWKVSRAVRFETQNGLEVTVRATPERVSGESDPRKQMTVTFAQEVKMLAKVDATLPPEQVRPKVAVVAEFPDAGVMSRADAAPAMAQNEPDVKPAAGGVKETSEVKPAVARGTRLKPQTRTASAIGTRLPRSTDTAVRPADTAATAAAIADEPVEVPSLTEGGPAPEAEALAPHVAREAIAPAAAPSAVPVASLGDEDVLGLLPLFAGGAVVLLLGVIVVVRRRRS